MKTNNFENLLTSILAFDPEALFRIRFVDYQPGVWTVSEKLTQYRIDKFAFDESLEMCEIQFSNGEITTLIKTR